MNKAVLMDIWRSTHHTRGWLSALGMVLTPEELMFLSDLEDQFQDNVRVLREAHRSGMMALKRPEVDAAWARSRRQEFLGERLAGAKRRLVEIRLERGRAVKYGEDTRAALCEFEEIGCAESVKKFQEMLARVQAPLDQESELTDEMIERARQVRIEVLLGDKMKVACPFHGEDRHPSASIAKGFFKCFTCGKRVDAIGWLMEVDGYSFPEAVKRLLGK
jgi:hypothetical protein